MKVANTFKATLMTKGVVAADTLTQADQQGMVFIKQLGISRQIIHKEVLIGSVAVAIGG